MDLFYVRICRRINMFALSEYKEYFTSESGMKRYIDFFEKNLYSEDSMWIMDTGKAYVNNNDMIVAEEDML